MGGVGSDLFQQALMDKYVYVYFYILKKICICKCLYIYVYYVNKEAMIRRSFEAGCITGFGYLPGSGDLRLHPGSQDRCVVCQGCSGFYNGQMAMENQKKIFVTSTQRDKGYQRYNG